MEPKSSVKFWLMKVEDLVHREKWLPVTSHSTFEPSSTRFHPEGLFSEEIFGQIGTPQRLERFGYIDLNTTILTPHIYKNLLSLKMMYRDILAGLATVRFDTGLCDFVACDKTHPEAGTGYNFFVKHFPMLKFEERASTKRNDKIKLLEKYRDRILITQFPVLPAGIRDVKEEDGRVSSEDINKLYLAMLSLSQAMPPNLTLNDSDLLAVYDGVRFNLQMKAVAIYEYIQSMLDDKNGYLQKKYTSRALIGGTRNVITASRPESHSPEDPCYLKYDESLIPLFQAAKMIQPAVVYQLRNMFYSQVFTRGASKVVGIDPKTLQTEYIEVTDQEINKAFASEEYEQLINSFENEHMREKYVTIRSAQGKSYYLYLVYDDGNRVYYLRNLADFQELMRDQGQECDLAKIRPLTYVEMMYIAVHEAARGKHALITRYPVLEVGSTYPSKIKVGTTVPSRVVVLSSQYDERFKVTLAHYPILKNKYQDSTILHPCKMKGLNGDHDGDTVSVNGVWLEECNQEITEYLHHPSSIATVNGQLIDSAATNVTKLVTFNLTR